MALLEPWVLMHFALALELAMLLSFCMYLGLAKNSSLFDGFMAIRCIEICTGYAAMDTVSFIIDDITLDCFFSVDRV